jgi:hypothetical protein
VRLVAPATKAVQLAQDQLRMIALNAPKKEPYQGTSASVKTASMRRMSLAKHATAAAMLALGRL